MRTCLIDTSDEEADTIRALAVVLGVCLGALADGGDDALEGDGAAVGEARGEGLLLHEVGEDASVGGQASEGDAEVFVDGDDFLLVGGEFFGIALEVGINISIGI